MLREASQGIDSWILSCSRGWGRAEGGARLELESTDWRNLFKGREEAGDDTHQPTAQGGVLGSTCFYMGSNVHDVLWSFVSQSLVPSLAQEGVQEWWEWVDVATIR